MILYTLLIVVLLLVSFVLVAAILMQAGKGGGLAANFGGAGSSDALFGTHQAGNILTKITWWAGGIFLGLSLVLSLTSSRAAERDSVLGGAFPTQSQPQTQQPPPVNPSAVQNNPLNPTGKADTGAGKAAPPPPAGNKIPPGF